MHFVIYQLSEMKDDIQVVYQFPCLHVIFYFYKFELFCRGIDGSSSSRDHYWNKYNSEASNPPLVLKDRYEAADRSRRRSGRWLVSDDYENQDSNNCDCLFMQVQGVPLNMTIGE